VPLTAASTRGLHDGVPHQSGGPMRSLLLFFLGVPIPIIILIALFVR
jgi:hypothetical protein